MAGTFILYHYTPSQAAAIILTLLFSIITLLHAIQVARFRAWFMLPVVVGGICTFPPCIPSPARNSHPACAPGAIFNSCSQGVNLPRAKEYTSVSSFSNLAYCSRVNGLRRPIRLSLFAPVSGPLRHFLCPLPCGSRPLRSDDLYDARYVFPASMFHLEARISRHQTIPKSTHLSSTTTQWSRSSSKSRLHPRIGNADRGTTHRSHNSSPTRGTPLADQS